MAKPIGNTDFIKLPLFRRGKVRDVYDLGNRLMIIVTDRISAFDVVFPNLIPSKGAVLNKLSEFWFHFTEDVVPNHMVSTDFCDFPAEVSQYREELQGRTMIVKKAEMIDIECVVRGYLAGSGLKEYKETGSVCGIKLPGGLTEGDKLPEPIFTPAYKAHTGHDENISQEQMADKVGKEVTEQLKELSLALYEKACKRAEQGGIILADTKFEFGFIDGRINLADEIFTPDSSRFWNMDEYQPGGPQRSFDKQYMRDYLESTGWDKNPPAPELPEYVVQNTELKYLEAYQRIVGRKLPAGQMA